MNGVFLDTVGLLAIWDTRDQWHGAAEAAFLDLINANTRLLSTPYVLVECGNAAARTPFRLRVNAIRVGLQEDGLLIEPTDDETELAWEAYDRGEAGDAGIVDHISFIVMRRLGLTTAFTNDKHFKAAGFVTLF